MRRPQIRQYDRTQPTQKQLRALVRLLALSAAHEYVSPSSTNPSEEDFADATPHPDRT